MPAVTLVYIASLQLSQVVHVHPLLGLHLQGWHLSVLT